MCAERLLAGKIVEGPETLKSRVGVLLLILGRDYFSSLHRPRYLHLGSGTRPT